MKSFEKELFTIYLLLDLFILNSCFVVFSLTLLDPFINGFSEHLMYFLYLNVWWIIAYYAFTKKSFFLRKGFSNRILRITKRVLIYTVAVAVTAFLFLPGYFSHRYFAAFSILFYSATIISYYIVYKYLNYKRKIGLNTIRTAITANCEKAHLLRTIIENNPVLGCKFVGFIVPEHGANQKNVLGSIHNLEELITTHQIQMIFSEQDTSNPEFNRTLVSKCDQNGVRLRFVMGHNHPFKLQPDVKNEGGIELLNPRKTPRDDVVARITKRLFDILFSTGMILFVFSWLFPVVAFIIKLTSKGPVFFYQKRTGFNNKTFTCIKFRSMRINGQADVKQASANDSRITPFGQFLRNSHIDELPQILNVFLGQMSVVGPRPHMLKHTSQYKALIDLYLIRHYVKPGITGWAQIKGYCGETDELWKMEKRVECDTYYVNNWSFYWDLQIIWRTFIKEKNVRIPSANSIFLRPVPKKIHRYRRAHHAQEV